MTEAAAQGIIRYSEFDSLNTKDLLREAFLLKTLERLLLRDMVKADYISTSSCSVWPPNDSSGQLYKTIIQYVDNTRKTLHSMFFPYLKDTLTAEYQDKFTWLRQKYKEVYGKDINSPEVQEQFKKEEELINRAVLQEQQKREYQKQQEEAFYQKLQEVYNRVKRK